MTSIIVTNFPSSAVEVTAVQAENRKEKIIFSSGYDPGDKSEDIIAAGLSSFFISLIVHDEVFLCYDDYKAVLGKIGPVDMLKLLDRKIIRLVADRIRYAVVHGDKYKFSSLSLAKDAMEDLEEKIQKIPLISQGDKALLAQYSDNARINMPDGISELVTKELVRDLEKDSFAPIGISTKSINDIQRTDVIQLLRIADIAHGLLLQNRLAVDALSQDGFVQQYLSMKFGAFATPAGRDGVSLFSTIQNVKGIPDLYGLYRRGTITIDDIIFCRETFSGGLFRKWYASTDYDEKKVLQALVNKKGGESPLVKFSRFIYPNVLGLIGPITGLVASAVDSYIVNKLVEGWSPSIFLDDVYKRKIDQRIAIQQVDEKKKQILDRFGKVGRNDLCPCQSGKKFKHCHGKSI